MLPPANGKADKLNHDKKWMHTTSPGMLCQLQWLTVVGEEKEQEASLEEQEASMFDSAGSHGKKIAVVENEFGEIGIDDALVMETKEEIFEMNNGGWSR